MAQRHQGQAQDVVEVGVRQEDVVDALHLFQGQRGHAGARVHQHILVDEEGRGVLPCHDAARAAEHTNLKGGSVAHGAGKVGKALGAAVAPSGCGDASRSANIW